MDLCDGCKQYAPLVLWAYTFGFCEKCVAEPANMEKVYAAEKAIYWSSRENTFENKLLFFQNEEEIP